MPSSIRDRKSCGLPPITAIPLSLSLPDTSGASSALMMSVLSRLVIGAGKPAGPITPNHEDGLRKAGSTSDIEGICGSSAKRLGSKTARILTPPPSPPPQAGDGQGGGANPRTLEIDRNAIGILPAITSCSAGATPR